MENKHSEATDVRGVERYRCASFDSAEYLSLLLFQQVNEFPLQNVINGSVKYRSTSEAHIGISPRISEKHLRMTALGHLACGAPQMLQCHHLIRFSRPLLQGPF